MQIKHKISFLKEESGELISYLTTHNITWHEGGIVSTVEMHEDSPHWQFVHQYTCEHNIRMLSSTVFSKAELDNAKWLRVRSQWRYGYPQPEPAFGYRSVTYKEGCRCDACGAGLEQIAPFRMTKEPNWRKRHFMMLNWVEDELFITDICRKILESENLSGISFERVCDKKGSSTLPNVNQLIISSRLEPGILTDRRSIDKELVCDSCGSIKYHPTGIGMLAFDKNIFCGTPDFIKTEEIFGWGKGASRDIIISQHAYNSLVRNKLNQGLVFEPVELV